MPDTTPLLPAPETPLLLAAPAPKPSHFAQHAKLYTGLALAAFLLLAFALGWFLHHRTREAAEDANEAQRDAIPAVTVVPVKRSPPLSEILLPGSLSPITEAALYARASGYVRRRYVDIGDSVRKGQVLADIESPDLDAQVQQGQATAAQAVQQLNQSRTAVGDAQAKLDLAKVTVDRYEILLTQDSVAGEDVDMQRQVYKSALAALASANAGVSASVQNLQAARANARRLVELKDFEHLRAPFDGIITARNVDEGALISNAGASLTSTDPSTFTSTGGSSSTSATGGGSTAATSGSSTSSSSGSSGGSGSELFRIAQVGRLRVYVTVPQESASLMQVGADATVFVQQFADPFHGKVSRTAGALDPSARTLLTEVQIANDQHQLMPGMYAQVRFSSSRSVPPLLVPGETLITRGSGTMVAVMEEIDAQDRQKLPASPNRDKARRVHLQPVSIGRDYGTEVEITGGLKGDEELVDNPSDTVEENAVMVPQGQKSDAEGAAASGPKKGGSDKKSKGSDEKKSGDADKKDGKSDKGAPPVVEPPKLPPPPAASAPAGAASSALGGPGDQSPNGLGSPSMAAPMQGGAGKGGGNKGGGAK